MFIFFVIDFPIIMFPCTSSLQTGAILYQYIRIFFDSQIISEVFFVCAFILNLSSISILNEAELGLSKVLLQTRKKT